MRRPRWFQGRRSRRIPPKLMGTMSKSATRWAPALYSWLCVAAATAAATAGRALSDTSICIFIFNARAPWSTRDLCVLIACYLANYRITLRRCFSLSLSLFWDAPRRETPPLNWMFPAGVCLPRHCMKNEHANIHGRAIFCHYLGLDREKAIWLMRLLWRPSQFSFHCLNNKERVLGTLRVHASTFISIKRKVWWWNSPWRFLQLYQTIYICFWNNNKEWKWGWTVGI